MFQFTNCFVNSLESHTRFELVRCTTVRANMMPNWPFEESSYCFRNTLDRLNVKWALFLKGGITRRPKGDVLKGNKRESTTKWARALHHQGWDRSNTIGWHGSWREFGLRCCHVGYKVWASCEKFLCVELKCWDPYWSKMNSFLNSTIRFFFYTFKKKFCQVFNYFRISNN